MGAGSSSSAVHRRASAQELCPNDPSGCFPPRQAFGLGVIGGDVPLTDSVNASYCVTGGHVNGPYDDRLARLVDGGRRWQLVAASGPAPTPRAACMSVAAGGLLYVFGGWEAETKAHLNDMHVFDSATSTWQQLAASDADDAGRPCPRRGGTLLQLDDARLLLCGGSTGMGRPALSDLWTFDTVQRSWQRVEQAADSPTVARYRHCAWLLPGGQLWLFGGTDGAALKNDLCCFDFATARWSVHRPAEPAPLPREAHTGHVLLLDGGHPHLCIFGGSGPHGSLADMWLVDVRTPSRWTAVAPSQPWPSPRCFHGTAAVPGTDGQRLWIVAGRTRGNDIVNDVHEIHITSV